MTEIIEVPSPFCGIGTDDLSVRVEGSTVKVITNGCSVNTPGFEQAVTDLSPRVAGKNAPLKEAVAKAANILQAAAQPLIGGCATDVNGMRALLAVADRSGAVVENMNFAAARNNYLALQDSGWMTTTLAEVKNRCDLLLVVGTDLEGFAPRFFERYLWNAESMFVADTSQRKVIYLGKAPTGSASTSPSGQKAQVVSCASKDLPEVLAVLRALVKGNLIKVEQVAGVSISDLQAIADALKQASYGVVTWSAGAFDFSQAELTVQVLSEMIKEINAQNTRCSGLPLTGKEGDQTANQVCGWITGYPARTKFSKGYPEYDPYLYDSSVMLKNGEVDALLWVNAFNVKALPPASSLPTIVLGRSGMKFDIEPEVFIPVGTPGIDHAGHAYRMDSVVAIRLKKLRDAGLPSTSEVLNAIEQVLKDDGVC